MSKKEEEGIRELYTYLTDNKDKMSEEEYRELQADLKKTLLHAHKENNISDEFFEEYHGKLKKLEEKTEIKICPQCWHDNKRDSVYCENCGYKFEEIKEENKRISLKKILPVATIIVLIGVALYFTLPWGETPETTIPTTTAPTTTSVSIWTTAPTTPAITTAKHDDLAFVNWMDRISSPIIADLENISYAANMESFNLLNEYGLDLYNDCSDALDEIDEYDVSPKLGPVQREFRLALLNYKNAGAILADVGPYDTKKMERATDYMETGMTHINVANEYIEEHYEG